MGRQKFLKDIVKKEDPKNPLTDQEIAEKLGISREQVVVFRKKLCIGSSQERRRESLLRDMEEYFRKDPTISARELTRLLKDKGYQISRYLVNKEFNRLRGKGPKDAKNEKERLFSSIIGHEGSLRPQIQQAKAAVLYPPLGLHTLIVGETGTGKSYLAQKMFDFAVKSGKVPGEKFVVFNCADYAHNPQLLYSTLFGHKKGSFTGATGDKLGLIDRADGGIFFLDEVHRLPPEGQEMLFNIIDHGRFRRLGETEEVQKVNVMIIAATTEEIESQLLATFRRRIPMIIEMPPLEERPLREKLEFIKLFIQAESNKINNSITLSYEAGRSLLNYNPASNVGQLEGDLKVACARAYLLYVTGEKENVEISPDTLPRMIRRNILEQPARRKEVSATLKDDLIIEPSSWKGRDRREQQDVYGISEDIYRYMEKKSREMKKEGASLEAISEELNRKIEQKLNLLLKQTRAGFQDDRYFSEIVGEEMVDLINEVQLLAQKEIPELVFKRELKYALGLHFTAALQRIRAGKRIVCPNLARLKREDSHLFEVARKITELFARNYSLELPEDEVGYVTVYLKAVLVQEQVEEFPAGNVEIIVACHGKVASNMLRVANWFLGTSNAHAIDMEMDESPTEIQKQIVGRVKNFDRNSEVLLLVDMGSLAAFGPIIREKTGLETIVVPRVDTVMLMDAIRLSKFKQLPVEAIVRQLEGVKFTEKKRSSGHTILLFCTTGEGAAQRIRDYLIHRLPGIEERYRFQVASLIGEDLNKLIRRLERGGELLCVVGNLRPELGDPERFFPIPEIFSDEGIARFMKAISFDHKDLKEMNLEGLFSHEIFFPQLRAHSPEEIIEKMAGRLFQSGAVKKSYPAAVLEREQWGPTYVGNGVVIPHADPRHVYYSQVALAALEKPLLWSEKEVEIVCMVALKELGVSHFKKLHRNLMDNVDLIKKAGRWEMIRDCLTRS
ncbi:MAG: sigma 54-interacting transcriptional regulator [Dethiobacteria bacterium]|jgi:transcriptional regulator with AAA-type ATPase domain/transcriptional regulatory protein LevR